MKRLFIGISFSTELKDYFKHAHKQPSGFERAHHQTLDFERAHLQPSGFACSP